MSKSGSMPDMAKLDLRDDHEYEDDEDVEDLFASPTPNESGNTTQKHTPNSQASSAQKTRSDSRAQAQNDAEAREARLRLELAKVREVNAVIEGVTTSLAQAKDKMDTVHKTVSSASTLLATWTRILSQTEHNQRLILDPNWGGASKDVEEEETRRQQEEQRRALEERQRRERLEEEERKRAAAAASAAEAPARGSRGSRGVRGSTRGYVGVGGQVGRGRGGTSTTGTRGTAGSYGTGIARTNSTRGRGRGLG